MAGSLPRSIFATPGARAYGDAGRLGAKDEYAGLQIAEYAITARKEVLRMPMFGFATSELRSKGGGRKARRPFYGRQLIHDANDPTRVGIRGKWLDTGEEILTYHQKKKMPQSLVKQLEVMEPKHFAVDNTWDDLVSLGGFEPSIKVLRGSTADLEVLAKPEVIAVDAIFNISEWKHHLIELDNGFGVQEIEAELDAAKAPPVLHPSPPSGLELLEQSTEPIDADAFIVKGKVFRVGTEQWGAHGASYRGSDGTLQLGRLEARPSQDKVVLTKYLTTNEVRAQFEFYGISDAYLTRPKELTLSEELVSIDVAQLDGPILVVNQRAEHLFSLEYPSATYPCESAIIDDEFTIIQEVLTEDEVKCSLVEFASSSSHETAEDIAALLGNEVRMQMVPEAQTNLADAVATLRGFSLARFLLLDDAAMDAEWRGDRTLTLDLYITDFTMLDTILSGNGSRGWVVPEKEPDKVGRVRKRTTNKGFMLLMLHADVDGAGSNVLSYCLETKKLEIRLSLAYFNMAFKWVRGAELPPPPASKGFKFDIVAREWQAKSAPPVWTLARALEHF